MFGALLLESSSVAGISLCKQKSSNKPLNSIDKNKTKNSNHSRFLGRQEGGKRKVLGKQASAPGRPAS